MIDLALLEIAVAAYGPATLETETCHAVVRTIASTAIVAFRGTDPASLTDLLRDADVTTFADPVLGAVTAGFYGDVAALAWRLLAQLPQPQVMVTGHSKGGAEALIFAAMLVHLGRPPARLTTFGAPRPGPLAGLVAGVAGADYRNAADPVPFLPPYRAPARPLTQLGDFRLTLDPLGDHALAAYRTALMTRGDPDGPAQPDT